MQIFGFQDYRSCILPAQNSVSRPIWFTLRKIYKPTFLNKEHTLPRRAGDTRADCRPPF